MDAVQIKNAALAVCAAVSTAVTQALGGWDAAINLLVVMMVVDYITGMMVAGIWHRSRKTDNGALDSRAGFKGLCRKGVMLLIVYLAVQLDKALGISTIRTATIFFFIGNEGLSLLENLGLMGVPYPTFMQRALEALKDQGNDGKVNTGKLPSGKE